MSDKEARDLLSKLCVELGFCLPPEACARIREGPPSDVLAFTDAVFMAAGMDPSAADRHLYRQVRDMVADAFREADFDGV